MTIELEKTILRNIISNETYMRKVLPFIKIEYFEGVYKELFRQVAKFVAKYNRLPSEESIKIELDDTNVRDEIKQQAFNLLPDIFNSKEEEKSAKN